MIFKNIFAEKIGEKIDVMIFKNIFAEKNRRKNWRFGLKTKLNFEKS
jgi:hypothetical protein